MQLHCKSITLSCEANPGNPELLDENGVSPSRHTVQIFAPGANAAYSRELWRAQGGILIRFIAGSFFLLPLREQARANNTNCPQITIGCERTRLQQHQIFFD